MRAVKQRWKERLKRQVGMKGEKERLEGKV
jgi:hypothetical protein